MKYQILGKSVLITQGVTDKVTKKLSKLEKFFDSKQEIECRAMFKAQKNDVKAEITIFTKEMTFRAEVEGKEMFTALDLCINKLVNQMGKLKKKLQKRSERPGICQDIILENLTDEAEELENSKIVRTKSLELKPMEMEDAITKMEAIGHDFFLYIDSEDDRVSVLYRRHDGGYGILQAENKFKI